MISFISSPSRSRFQPCQSHFQSNFDQRIFPVRKRRRSNPYQLQRIKTSRNDSERIRLNESRPPRFSLEPLKPMRGIGVTWRTPSAVSRNIMNKWMHCLRILIPEKSASSDSDWLPLQ